MSPGCENCYAENLMDRRYHKVEWGPGKPRSRTKTWNDPVKWNRQAGADGIRKRVFCASLADWLDAEVPHQWREDLFDLIEACPNLDWLMLTKRPENAARMTPLDWWPEWPKNIWFGVTAENQKYWEQRVPILQTIPAAVRWVSYEPALGPLLLPEEGAAKIDWLIIGGESEQMSEARPFELEWAAMALTYCRLYGMVPFLKQLGSNALHAGQPYKTKDKAGTDPGEWPEILRVREFPRSPCSAPLAI